MKLEKCFSLMMDQCCEIYFLSGLITVQFKLYAADAVNLLRFFSENSFFLQKSENFHLAVTFTYVGYVLIEVL